MPESHLAQARKLHEQLFAQRVQAQPRLERRHIGRPRPIIGRAQALARRHCGPLGLGQSGSLGTVVGKQGVERLAGPSLTRHGGGQPSGHDVPLVAPGALPVRQCRQLPRAGRDAALGERQRGLRAGPAPLHLAPGPLALRHIAGQPVPACADLRNPTLPGGRCLGFTVPIRVPGRPGRPGPRRLRIHDREGRRCPFHLASQPLGLGRVPGGLPRGRLQVPASGPLHILRAPAMGDGSGLGDAGLLQGGPGTGRARRRGSGLLLRGVTLRLQRSGLPPQTVDLGAPLQRRVAASHPQAERVDDRRSVPRDREPAQREHRLQLERRAKVRRPDRAGQQRADSPVRVPADGIGQPATPCDRQRVLESSHLARRPAARVPLRTGESLPHDHVAALSAQGGRTVAPDDVRPRELSQGRLDRGPQPRVNPEILVHALPAEPARSARDPSLLLVRQPAMQLFQAATGSGEHRTGPSGPFRDGPPRALGTISVSAGVLADPGGPRLRIRRDLERRPSLDQGRLQARPPAVGIGGPGPLLGGAADRLGVPTARGLGFAGAGRFRAPEGRQLVAPCPTRGAQGPELGQRFRERPVRLGQRCLELQVPLRDVLGEDPPLGGKVGVGCRLLVGDPAAVPDGRLDLTGCPGLAQPELRDLVAGGLVRRALVALQLGARGHRRGDIAHRGLHRLEGLERLVRLDPQGVPSCLGRSRPARGLVPALVGGGDQGGGELLTGGEPGRLLLGQLPQPTRLRPELGQDVIDAGEVGLGLRQLFLGLAPPALVAAHPGDLLEQRASFLGAERERLVDHALADEQEGILSEVGGVEQVLEVTQPDALPVEQVVVLARAVESPAQFDHRKLDGQESVAVVEDEGDVRHALGAAPLGPGPDDVLAAADAERPALLSHGPAQRVGQVGLARAVGSDDRADARPELDQGALGKGLEPLDAEAQEAGRRGHDPGPAGSAGWGSDAGPADGSLAVPVSGATAEPEPRAARAAIRSVRMASSASAAADVSATRLDGPSPTPRERPSTTTSMRNCRSWSGPATSSSR